MQPGDIQPDPPPDIDRRSFAPEVVQRLHADCTVMFAELLKRRRQGWRAPFFSKLRVFIYRTAQSWHELTRADCRPPLQFLDPYPIDGDVFYHAQTPPKYTLRPHNLVRDYYRYLQLCPEILTPGQAPLQILDLSPGGCAAAEILSPLGHHVTFAEYGPNIAKTYHALHAHLGVRPIAFDGSILPYPFESQSMDYVFCFQALDFYTKDVDYARFIHEMTRIARKTVVIVFNSHPAKDEAKVAALRASLTSLGPYQSLHCPDNGNFALRLDL